MMIYSILALKNEQGKLNSLLSGMNGISGTDIFPVQFGEITAVVSDIDKANLIADKSNAIEYAGVIENLAQQFTLLPMRFGSVMGSVDAIVKMLEKNYPDIQLNLQKVENKYEFGLKIFCDPEKLKAELIAKSEADSKTFGNPPPEMENSIYRDYVNKKLKEHRLEELLVSYADSVIAEITGFLVGLNAINKFKKMATATNIIDAVFLLEKDKKDILVDSVRNLQNQHVSLTFVLTGPWPPYSFADFTVK